MSCWKNPFREYQSMEKDHTFIAEPDMLKLYIKRISQTHHTLRYVREDGSGEEAPMETKSTLLHDFMHLAIETEANLTDGFFGLLDHGYTYAELNGKAPSEYPKEEGMEVEMVVGPFTSLVKGHATPAQLIQGLEHLFEANGKKLPGWVSVGLFERALDRYRRIVGAWNSCKFGEILELEFGGQYYQSTG